MCADSARILRLQTVYYANTQVVAKGYRFEGRTESPLMRTYLSNGSLDRLFAFIQMNYDIHCSVSYRVYA